MSNTETGVCLCGQLRCSFERDKVFSSHHCHCSDCQKNTGSGKATFIMMPTEALSIEGEMKTYSVTGTEGATITRGFCPNCGSPMVSVIEEMPHLRIVKAGILSDSSWVKVGSSFWSSSAQEWSPVESTIPSFEQNPPMEKL